MSTSQSLMSLGVAARCEGSSGSSAYMVRSGSGSLEGTGVMVVETPFAEKMGFDGGKLGTSAHCVADLTGSVWIRFCDVC